MKSSHHLFDLIQSLTSSEKSYFKKNSTTDGSKEKSYIKLFDIINEMKVYDENILFTKLKKAGIEKSISNLKDYLYELILENLVNYHKNAEDEYILMQKYLNNKILLKKGLFEQAKLYSKDLAILADEKQNNLVRLISLDPYLFALSFHNNIDDLELFISSFEKTFLNEIEQIKNIYYCHLLFIKNALQLKKNNTPKDDNEIEEIKKDYSSLIDKFTAFQYPLIESAFNNELGVYYCTIRDLVQEYIYKKKSLDMMLDNLALVELDFNHFSVMCYNVSFKSLLYRLYDQYEYLISKITKIKNDYQKSISPFALYHLDITYYGIVLTFYKQTKMIQLKKEVIDEVVQWSNTTNHASYYFKNRLNEYIIESYYITGQYNKAVKHITQWLHDGDKNKIRNKASAWVYLLIIHFEEENYDLVSSLFVPAIKYFRQCGLENNIISNFINYFKLINNNIHLLSDKVALKRIIDDYPTNEKVTNQIGTFNFRIWLRSKYNNCTYYEQYCVTLKGYNYEMLDQLIEQKVPLYETDFLKDYKKTGIQIK